MRAGATDGLATTAAAAGVAADDAAGAAGSFGTNALPSQSSGSLIVLLCAALSVAHDRRQCERSRAPCLELDIFAKVDVPRRVVAADITRPQS
jgi:hypothetical protein